MNWLYRYEAKGIQQYILATEKLREISGASALVESLTDDLKSALRSLSGEDVEVHSAAAGAATVTFAREADLRAFAALWPMVVARTRPGLHVVQAWRAVEPGQALPISELLDDMRAARQALTPDLPEAGPWLARAGRTGLPAIRAAERAATRDGQADRATHRKVLAAGRDPLAERLRRDDGSTFTIDPDDFGEADIAVFHADGNDVGRFLNSEPRVREAQAYRAFSDGLRGATESAARAAIAEVVPTQRRLPLRPVLLGGDDFTVLLRASDALRFAETFLLSFEAETRSRLAKLAPKGFTACAGIAFVKPGYPFHQGYALSEALCAAAKSALRSTTAPTPSGILFHRVTDSAARSWREIVADRSWKAGGASRTLIAGPWTLGAHEQPGRTISDLKRLAASLRSLPMGSVREWLREAEDDSRARARWERTLEVLKARDPQACQGLRSALAALGDKDCVGWTVDGRTPLLDALVYRAMGLGEVR
jgi:hypothetical protein